MTESRLDGRRVLVTGASSGIGAATCRASIATVAGQNLQGAIHTGNPQRWRELLA